MVDRRSDRIDNDIVYTDRLQRNPIQVTINHKDTQTEITVDVRLQPTTQQ